MDSPFYRKRVVSALLLAGLLGAALHAEDRTYSFDRGERDDLEKGVVIKDVKPNFKKKSKKEAERNARALRYHLQNLNDKDPQIRETSAEMLGMLNAVQAVPPLIELLKDEHLMVQLKAHAALNKITGKNFGYKNYSAWKRWWLANQKDFLEKKTLGPSELAKIRAKNSNTLGLESLRTGQLVMAMKMFRDAVNQDPEIPDYRNNLGLAVMEMGRYVDAIVYFREAMGLDDALPQPYMNIGTCYARMDKHIEAQHWFRKAMKKDKNGKLWEPFWTLGKDFLRKGNFNMAWEFLDQARVKAERNRVFDPRIYRDLALTHYGLDQYHSAWKEIKNVEQLGYQLDKGFVEKVRKALEDQGINPDEEDKKARAPSP